MDKLHREHQLIIDVWKFMKSCETYYKDTEEFWTNVHSNAAVLATLYSNFPFITDWLTSYMKFLEESKNEEHTIRP